MAFVHALLGHKPAPYGDTAIDYLNAMKDRPDISPSLKAAWKLEMSNSLKAAAMVEPDAAARDKMNADAVKLLGEYAKENPDSAASVQAQMAGANLILGQAQELLAVSRVAPDEKQKQAALISARTKFEEAAPLLKKGADNLKDRIKKLPPPVQVAKPNPKQLQQINQRDDLETEYAKAIGQWALINYQIAQTYTIPSDAEVRTKNLKSAAQSLDDLFQEFRDADPNSVLGRLDLNAHVWSGKIAEELNDLRTAKDIYEEVRGNLDSPDANEPVEKFVKRYERTIADDILARNEFFYIMLTLKEKDKDEAKLFEPRMELFLSYYKKPLGNEWGYQAAEIEYAKYLAAKAEKAPKAEAKKLTDQALKIASDLAATQSEFQRDAVELRRKITGAATETAQTEAEAKLLADEAAQKKDWETAVKWYSKALELVEKDKSPDPNKERPGRMNRYRELIALCQFEPAAKEYADKRGDPKTPPEQFLAWHDSFIKVAKDNPKTEVAKEAAGLAVNSITILYSKLAEQIKSAKGKDQVAKLTAQKEDARKRLQDSVDFIMANYAGTGAADEATLALGQAYLYGDGNRDEAIKQFEKVSPNFERYANVLQDTAKLHYTRYFEEKSKPEDKRNAKQMEEDLAAAKTDFQKVVDSVKAEPGKPIPQSMIDAKLLLAQLYFELQEYPKVTATLHDFIAAINPDQPPQLDKSLLQMFQLAMRAYMAQEDFKDASNAGEVLIKIGPDTPDINNTLVSFIVGLDKERKKVQDELKALPDSAPPSQTEPLRAKIGSIKDMMIKMLDALASRDQLQPSSLVFIGNLFSDMDETGKAQALYGKFLDKVEKDENYKKSASSLILKVRNSQIEMLTKSGNYAGAAEQAEAQCKANPRQLDCLMARARIYQKWGAQDPSKYETAFKYYAQIRKGLEKPQKIAQYYEAAYNAAVCLRDEAKKLMTTDKTEAAKKLLDAAKWINSVVEFNPKLDGEESVKKFSDLKKDIEKMRGTLPAPAVAAPSETTGDSKG